MHEFEGYRNKPYKCTAFCWTVGWGHLMYNEQLKLPIVRKEGYTGIIRNEFPLKEEDNRVWSRDELEKIFVADLVSFERGVLRLCPAAAGRQGIFDSLVSFAFNVGLGNLQRSSLRMKTNRGEFEAAADEFLKWTKAGGRVLPGLVKRRNDERAMYLSGVR